MSSTPTAILTQLFRQTFGITPQDTTPLTPAGSNRRYFRLTGADRRSVIGVENVNIAENEAFLYLARHLRTKGLPTPEIFAVNEQRTHYLQEDFGDCSLYDALRPFREQRTFSQEAIDLLERTLRLLPHVQIKGGEGLDPQQLLSPTHFDRRTVMFDLNYFKYCFLRPSDVPFDEEALEDDFEQLSANLTYCSALQEPQTFLYRDFQARNIMLVKGQPRLIDFQGGRIGPVHYDVASFLWQASAQYPDDLREQLISVYIDELSTLHPVRQEDFHQQLDLFVLFRLLQVLGAYGLRGLYEHKPYFLASIPKALSSLHTVIQRGVTQPYSTIQSVLLRLIALPQYKA